MTNTIGKRLGGGKVPISARKMPTRKRRAIERLDHMDISIIWKVGHKKASLDRAFQGFISITSVASCDDEA